MIVKSLLERSLFGVCSYLAFKMGLASSRVRLYFIYLSFLTFGSPIFLYLVAAFWLDIRKSIRNGKKLI